MHVDGTGPQAIHERITGSKSHGEPVTAVHGDDVAHGGHTNTEVSGGLLIVKLAPRARWVRPGRRA